MEMRIGFTSEILLKNFHISDALRDLVPFLQFKKREKHPNRATPHITAFSVFLSTQYNSFAPN